MTIRFRCAGCNRSLAVDDRHAGAKVKCPSCSLVAVVPKAAKARRAADRRSYVAGDSDEITPVRFTSKRISDDEMDMTPMVDITFLLLIFFMVTAAFSLQKSIEIPPPDQRESVAQARTLEELEQDDDYVIVEIHRDNTMFVDDIEAISEQDLLLKLRAAREGVRGGSSKGPSSLLVLADGDCRHEAVVMALDAGNAVGMESVRLATREGETF